MLGLCCELMSWLRKPLSLFAYSLAIALHSEASRSFGTSDQPCIFRSAAVAAQSIASTLFAGAGHVTTSSECRGERGATRLVRWLRTRDHLQANHSFSRADWLTPRSRAQAWLPQHLRREMG